jgi:hypothetical protein
MGKKGFNLAADMKTASARTQRPIAVQRLACTVHPLKSSEACLQGPIQPMSRHAATKNTAFPEFLSQSFLKLGCARLIRQFYAQLHLSKSPSYRRAVGRSAWCLAHGQHRRIVAQGPDRRGTERNAVVGSPTLVELGAWCCTKYRSSRYGTVFLSAEGGSRTKVGRAR